MHLVRAEKISFDESAQAVDLEQSPADIVALSFADSDLALLGNAHAGSHPSLRLAPLAQLKHPYSVDLYIEKVCAHARFVLVRLLGGMDYWRYGVDELAASARKHGFALAVVPGDAQEDARLDTASTLPLDDLRRIWAYFREGGPNNIAACLDFIAAKISGSGTAPPAKKVAAFGVYAPANVIGSRGRTEDPWTAPALRDAPDGAPQGEGYVIVSADSIDPIDPIDSLTLRSAVRRAEPVEASKHEGINAQFSQQPARAHALILFYRSAYLAADCAPIEALAQALAREKFSVRACFISSLKDPQAVALLREELSAHHPDAILNATAFSGRQESGGALDAADAPVFQVIVSGASRAQWASAPRGLSAADLAMNVVLPETDGRIITRAISFKREQSRSESLEYAPARHEAEPSRIAFVAALAARWARLRRKPNADKKLALILSDYPAKGGRAGYAVGLDVEASAREILARLAAENYTVAAPPDALLRVLEGGDLRETVSLDTYRGWLQQQPADFVAQVHGAWGEPDGDAAVRDGVFHFRFLRLGHVLVALQPDRGAAENRKSDYHDQALPPRHAFLAFYLWLRAREDIDALIHCGAHGSLEWLPGKAAALSESCAPEIALGPTPLIYPFIVNNPGEAAQAKRRSAAVIVSHLSPVLRAAGLHGDTAEIENLFDEYAQAQGLDPRRAKMLADLILQRAQDSGLLKECGAEKTDDALFSLDAWLCDVKDMRINDGLHVFGRSPQGDLREAMLETCEASSLDACGPAELDGLIRALRGGFVEPSPSGAPGRARKDVLPTGRNLFSVDPRAIPTRTAWEIGRKLAQDFIDRYLQDHGDWPRRIVLDLWGSASMRTGGDDLAQAFALLGVRPLWDESTTRMSGFEVLSLAQLGRPRVDVTLRISGLFRDVFPQQIEAFDAAVKAVAARDETPEDNPLAGSKNPGRIFGAASGAYGVDLGALATGDWREQSELAQKYLAASAQNFSAQGAGENVESFAQRIRAADAFVHVQDLEGQDILNADACATHEGGFAAAAEFLNVNPALYHVDATRPEAAKVRTLTEEISRVMRARATNPVWLAGMMRHGHSGAAQIAETVDNLFAFAALTNAVEPRHFDALFDATCGDDNVRAFLEQENPRAARAIADKFAQAQQRGFWDSRRNSTAAILAEMRMQ
jgi:cobaltochelatase CobN